MLTKRLTIDSVNLDDRREMDAFDDQAITAGIERVRAEGDELRRDHFRAASRHRLLQ